MAAETGGGVYSPVDPVPGKIVAAMLGAAEGIILPSQRRFEFGTYCVAVITETLLVAHGADLGTLPGQGPVAFQKV